MNQLIPAVSSKDHISGTTTAIIELVEYGDYQCPHCGHAYPIVKDLQKEFGEQLSFVFRNFPLSKIHPQAFISAVATEAAGYQDKFWELHDVIFENQRTLSIDSIMKHAEMIGLDVNTLKFDMLRNELIAKVEEDFDSGIRSGVSGTPTFFINGKKFDGDWTSDELPIFIRELAGSNSTAPVFAINQ